MILVTGADGLLGRRIVGHLLARVGNAAELAVSVRDPARAADFAGRGIAVRQGDGGQPETLARAFAGAEKLILVPANGPRAVRIACQRNAIAAAKAAGVGHILYASSIDVAADSPSKSAAVHRATEADLAASGLPATLLRRPLYADLLPMSVAAAPHTGSFQLPAGKGRASFVSRDELAEAIAAAAVAPALAKGTYELSGQATHDYHEVAAALATVVGKPVRYEAVSPEAYVRTLADAGLPPSQALASAGLYAAVAAGGFDRAGNDFAALVGHPPRPLACLVRELFGTE